MKVKLPAALSAVLVIVLSAPAWGDVTSAEVGNPGAAVFGHTAEFGIAWKALPSSTTEEFAGQNDRHALDIARRHDPELFTSQPTRTLNPPSGSKVKTYLDDYSARIAVAGQKADVIATSTTPLRIQQDGVERPVDLQLVRSGSAVEPKTPVVPLSFSDTLGGGVTIGNDIRIRVVGADASANAEVDGQQVFYANALTDADVFATPTQTGLESFVQLRSAQSPHTIAFQFDLPIGARLVEQPDDRSVAIVRTDKILATVSPPVSTDANNALVPTSMHVDGTHVILDVGISGATAFPVLVDPSVVDNQFLNGDGASSNGSFQNTLGWRRETSGPLGNFTFSPNGDNPSTGGPCVRYLQGGVQQTLQNQLCVSTQSSRTYNGELGQWAWRPPAGTRSSLNDGANIDTDAYIYLAQVRHSYTRLSTSGGSYMYAGIRSGRTGAWIGHNYNVDQGGAASDFRDGAWSFGQGVSGVISNPSFLRTYCAATDCSIDHSTEPNYDGASFAFGVYALGSGHALSANAQGAVFYQYDRTPPTAQQAAISDLSSWKSSGTVTTQVSGTDAGMGMKSVGVTYTDKNRTPTAAGYSYPCTGGILNTCPRTLSQNFAINVDTLPEGADLISSSTFDVLGKQTNGPVRTVLVDRTPPTGSLVTPPDAVHGTTTVSGTLGDAFSGPGRWALEVTPDGSSNWQTTCSSTQAALDASWSCAWNTDTLTEGTYQIRARLEDAVLPSNGGPNVAWTTPMTIQIDRTPPTLPAGLTLGSNYVSSSQSVVVDWDTGDDPVLPDGSDGSGVGAYQYRLRINGGAWSDPVMTADMTAAVPSAKPGDTIDIQLVAFDNAHNQTATHTATTIAPADCGHATDIGFLSDCQTAEMTQPDSTPAEDVDLVEQPPPAGTATASSNARRFTIHVHGGPWTTIRNAPNSLVIGNAHDGWPFDATRGLYNDDPAVPNSDLGWRAGAIGDLFSACGWLKESAESGAADNFVTNACPPKADAVIGQRQLATAYNCSGCNRGTRVKLIRSTPMWANVTPNPAQGRPVKPNGSPIRTISTADVARGYYVDWRYLTKPVLFGHYFIMVRDVGFDKANARTDNAAGVWVFIKRSALPANLCQKGQVTVATGCGSSAT